ncbi:cysteine hydrolase [Leptolyngbya boryana CZ1]|uniref:Cysteine hydrolase n=1 Tax=Leptolyngbya boryana CZ1 TaxID=3060204 RepID=A0AA97AKJ9_LEPBY|nr:MULTISPECIES: cysteine hydrolase [Leptolyngbya]MBN8564738.1 cysteine hydrolase [Leptolyngbya sp. UWPOB_LEPTO1]WNZ43343.1 cysteine hydrolase [Leptolyngbya boryana CZ1]
MNSDQTALILIGYQNDYFSSRGVLHNVIEESARLNNVLNNTVALLNAIASTSILRVATPIFFTSNYEELIEPVGILKTIQEVGAFRCGTFGAEMSAELQPFAESILQIPGKQGFNAFAKTNLDFLFKKKGITNLILAGAVTSICIDSTGRHAHERGYHVTVLSDCTSARTMFEQQFYCENIFPLYADVMTHIELLQQLGC